MERQLINAQSPFDSVVIGTKNVQIQIGFSNFTQNSIKMWAF